MKKKQNPFQITQIKTNPLQIKKCVSSIFLGLGQALDNEAMKRRSNISPHRRINQSLGRKMREKEGEGQRKVRRVGDKEREGVYDE